MASKSLVMVGMVVGSTIGGLVPMLFGISAFSMWSVVSTAVGGIIGVWIAFKLTY